MEAGGWLQTVVNKLDPNIPFSSYNINEKYYLEDLEEQLRMYKEFLEAKNFPHISIDNLFKEEKLLELKESLNSEKYYLEEIYKQIEQMEKENKRAFTQLSLF